MGFDLLHYLYNGLLRFKPIRKHFNIQANYKGNFPVVGFLNDETISELEQILGIKIYNPAIFEQAFIHRSYLPILKHSKYFSNERLEFLGDSILGMVVADYLFSLHSHVPEGELTKMRSWLVNSNSLALTARKLLLDKFIKLSFSAEKSLKQGSDSILADALEALIGAIYVDSGFDAAKQFIIHSIIPIELNESLMKDDNYKSILLEKVQSKGYDAPKYNIIDEFGPDHDKTFTVGVYINDNLVAKGSGKSKKQAEQSAAKKALKKNFSFK